MITLAITSSTALVGVAIANVGNGGLLAERSILTDRRHAEEITPMLAAAVAEAGLSIADIERIVVDVGPGRYTGMRVGIATAKALAFALGVPVASITSLDLIARAARELTCHDGPIFAVVDARRDQVFAQEADEAGLVGEPLVLSPSELADRLPSHALLVGDGADRYVAQFETVATVRRNVGPSIAIGALLPAGYPSGPGRLVAPVYMREPDAAINIKTRHSAPPTKKPRGRR
ncbi:MAG: tRNA (adenosine(37)-N6)-threonylcarbamoyltransferase complex dimerization subunit type 1 TsaB [Acidimicrobiales bacterium]|nr:tRNA (adenosine(37)-N6)-threonylcarbamoyltransferase complex dimerization subunit type 1 TsaB [Acidimicrobiales bacterium]